MSLSKDRNSQPVWQPIPVLLGKIFFRLSNCNLWSCYLWLFSLLCGLALPRGVWRWCPNNCPSYSCKQLLNHPVVSSSPNSPCPAASGSLHRVCVLGTLVDLCWTFSTFSASLLNWGSPGAASPLASPWSTAMVLLMRFSVQFVLSVVRAHCCSLGVYCNITGTFLRAAAL